MLSRVGILLFLILVLNLTAWAQPVAGFNISVTGSNCNPAVYSFTNTSTGGALTYTWNFGVHPGVNSIFQNPSTIYLNCGTFQVKLVVTDSTGREDSTTKTVNIRCSPVASFTSPYAIGCVPMTTTFTSTSSPGSGSITNYLWDFGDGSSGSGAGPLHTYNAAGCKNVTLIVTNSYNCVSDTTLNNLLCVYVPPVSNFTSNAQTACTAPFTVNYQVNSSGGEAPYSYHWIFQGGTPDTSTSANPVVTYNGAGSFNTTLITTDAHGCSDTLVQSNYITVMNYTAGFTLSSNPRCAPVALTANSSSSPHPLSWHWSVNEPGTAENPNSQNSSFNLPDTGGYNICLTITYAGGCTAQQCSPVIINGPPVAKFGVQGVLNTCLFPDSITFIDSSSGAGLSYAWSFTGGIPAASTLQTPPVVTYDTCGNYSASLAVTDDNGCSATYSQSNFLHLQCYKAGYTVSPSYGCLPLIANFNSTGSTGNPVSWLWNFDDPSSGTADSSSLQNPSHTYNQPGCYTISLTTANAQGCVYTYQLEGGVCTGAKPHANFSGNPPENCADKPFQFMDSSFNTYAYTTYAWDFTGLPFNIQSTSQNPSHTYYNVGIWDITLIVSNYGCADTITKDDYVQTLYPLAIPKVIPDCANPLAVILNGDSSEDAQNFKWIILGGGVPDSALTSDVTVTFPGPGSYNASLYVENDTTGCSDLENVVVNITGAAWQFTGTPLSGCEPLQSCMHPTTPDAVSYNWTVTNEAGIWDTSTSASSPCFHFYQSGLYNVQLIATDSFGCIDTIYKPDYISVSAPVVGFSGVPLTGCAPLTVAFFDSSITTGAGIAKWTWSFGDNSSGAANSSHLQNPVHTYIKAGNYSISLSITDSNGCTNTIFKNNYVIVDKPSATFTVSNQPGCQGTLACFTVGSFNSNYTYQWNFGDGGIADTANACHIYSTTGSFHVSLVATDSAGCTDTATGVNTAKVIVAHPAFTSNDSTSTCPPLSVQFTNISTGTDSVIAWAWQFGDGQVSTLKNPFHIYTNAGMFTVTLIAYNSNGCTDTLIDTDYIRISGPSAYVTDTPTSGCVPHYTCMAAASSSAIAYTWNFGDGTVIPGNSDSVCYTYTRTGTFYPELILSDSGGCIVALPLGTVNVLGTVAAFTSDSNLFCAQQATVQFTDSSYGSSNVQSRLWNFGDVASGALDTSSSQNPAHFFAGPGSYHVVENILSVNGCRDSASEAIIVDAPPLIKLNANDSLDCGPATVLFTGQATSMFSIINWLWNFGDSASGAANVSALQNPSHNYALAGTYLVNLVVVDANGCSADAPAVVTVHQKPLALFTAFDTCINTQPTVFTNNSRAANSYIWNFGDGGSSSLTNPVHTYYDSGSFIAQLIAQNAYCSDTFSLPVQIFPIPEAAFGVPTGVLCGPPTVLTVNNTSSNANSYSWNFGDSTFSTLAGPTVIYTSAGAFNILLAAMNIHGCADTTVQSIMIYPKPVVENVGISPAEGCAPLTVTFNLDATYAQSYNWNFGTGDGATSGSRNVTFTYSEPGAYTVSLYLSSAQQCTDTVVLPDTIKVYEVPVANFDPVINSSVYPYDGVVDFVNLSSNAGSYFWDFGDGSNSTETDPSHRYPSIDTFSALLIASTPYGCIDSIIKSFYIIKKSLYIPNALQPGFTGPEQLVKVWKPVGIGLRTYEARIYDKWGQLLWESDSISGMQPAEAWDGTYLGKPCEQDVYVWKINATFIDGSMWPGMSYDESEGGGEKTIGSITLIR